MTILGELIKQIGGEIIEPIIPPPPIGDRLLLENGFFWLKEDGGFILLEDGT
jgi:hypothetical protein